MLGKQVRRAKTTEPSEMPFMEQFLWAQRTLY